VVELDRVLDDVLGCSNSDLIVFALKQLHEDINGLGNVALDPGDTITEGFFVLGLLECCSKGWLFESNVNARRGSACLAASLVDGIC
jgi:hypothetical protein